MTRIQGQASGLQGWCNFGVIGRRLGTFEDFATGIHRGGGRYNFRGKSETYTLLARGAEIGLHIKTQVMMQGLKQYNQQWHKVRPESIPQVLR